MTERIESRRLLLRAWRLEDAADAAAIYHHAEVARWLSPDMDTVGDQPAMRVLLQQWIGEDARSVRPCGRWAIQLKSDGRLIGGVHLLPLPLADGDIEIGWQLHPDVWGQGFATETTFALGSWAFDLGANEIFAIVRPGNARAASAVRGNGMEWVGQTDKYYGISLDLFRLRRGDLNASAQVNLPPTAQGPNDR